MIDWISASDMDNMLGTALATLVASWIRTSVVCGFSCWSFQWGKRGSHVYLIVASVMLFYATQKRSTVFFILKLCRNTFTDVVIYAHGWANCSVSSGSVGSFIWASSPLERLFIISLSSFCWSVYFLIMLCNMEKNINFALVMTFWSNGWIFEEVFEGKKAHWMSRLCPTRKLWSPGALSRNRTTVQLIFFCHQYFLTSINWLTLPLVNWITTWPRTAFCIDEAKCWKALSYLNLSPNILWHRRP